MFEYLMPLLVMPNYENTLLDRTYQAVVRRQIEYGRQRGVPWGISESGYNTIDQHRTYQYRAFGVPGLGLKRGLAEDLVIAPYASALALMVAPEAACRNLERLAADGQQGAYGFYEAIDYTPSRLPPGAEQRHRAAVHGASRRDEPAVAGVRAARQADAAALPGRSDAAGGRLAAAGTRSQGGRAGLSACQRSQRHAAGVGGRNGQHARLHRSQQCGGGSPSALQRPLPRRGDECRRRLQPLARSGGDALARGCDARLLRQLLLSARSGQRRGVVQHLAADDEARPRATKPSSRKSRAEFRRTDEQIETYTQISVSPEDDIELRRVTLTNRSETPRTIEITSYAEVVLATAGTGRGASGVQQSVRADRTGPRSTGDLLHASSALGRRAASVDDAHDDGARQPRSASRRTKPIGCGSSAGTERSRRPRRLIGQAPLSNTAGPVLDPVVSIRQTAAAAAATSRCGSTSSPALPSRAPASKH